MTCKPTVRVSQTAFRTISGSAMTLRSYTGKEIIFSQGDIADALFYVRSGTVKLTVMCARHKKAVIAFLRRGSFFGEGCLSGQPVRIYTAQSFGPSEIARLPAKSAVRAIKRDPRFAKLFNAYLISRIIRIEEDLVDQFFNFSERRLARVLLVLAQIIEDLEPHCNVKVSQSTLAEMVGTTRARISKFMTEFKRKGFVAYNGSLQINRALLADFLKNQPVHQPRP
jgi:CRP/FNR family transcriptional regulator, cyclic AMP receptor protein